jgi:predicted esterase
MGLRVLTFKGMFPIVSDMDIVFGTFHGFSLKDQGYLQPHANQAPLLTIHGTEDRLMPVSDVYLLTESGIKQDALIYEGDGHMAWEHIEDHQAKMITWLQEKLDVK